MNRAFTHAEGELDVTVAYYAASQMLVFTAEQFGFPGITHALEALGAGQDARRRCIKGAFGVSPDEYDARYRAWEAKRSRATRGSTSSTTTLALGADEAKAAVAAAPQDAAAHVGYAMALLRAQEGRRRAPRDRRGACSSNPPEGRALRRLRSSRRGATTSTARTSTSARIQAAGGDGYTVQMALAELAEARKDKAGARAALEAAHRFDPTQAEPLRAPLRPGERREARRRRARGAARDRAPRSARPARVQAPPRNARRQRKQWDEAKQVGRVGDLRRRRERAGPRRLRARARRHGRSRGERLRARERAALRAEADRARDDARAPGRRAPRPRRRERRARAAGRGAEARPGERRREAAEDRLGGVPRSGRLEVGSNRSVARMDCFAIVRMIEARRWLIDTRSAMNSGSGSKP